MALLIPKGKRNRENKLYLTSMAILRLLDQFASAREGAKAYRGMSYDEIARACTTEDKPKQSQFQDPGSTIHVGQGSGG